MPDADKVYFDTMLYLNKFQDPFKIRPETNHMFSKVKSGEFRLVISRTTLVEIYHVLCLPLEEITDFKTASDTMDEITKMYHRIQETMLSFPNTEFPDNEYDGIDPKNLINFVESVPGSALIDFHGKKLPGSMDFIHLMIASNLKCGKFFTEDKGVLGLDSYNHKGSLKIIKPYRP